MGPCASSPFHKDKDGLERYLRAQDGTGPDRSRVPPYSSALSELKAGRKTSHWIWYVFPQMPGRRGSGHFNGYFAIHTPQQAVQYLQHPVLGSRYRACVEAVSGHLSRGSPILRLMGHEVDAHKLHESVTTFFLAALTHMQDEDWAAEWVGPLSQLLALLGGQFETADRGSMRDAMLLPGHPPPVPPPPPPAATDAAAAPAPAPAPAPAAAAPDSGAADGTATGPVPASDGVAVATATAIPDVVQQEVARMQLPIICLQGPAGPSLVHALACSSRVIVTHWQSVLAQSKKAKHH